MALPACGVLCCGVLWCVLQIIVTHDQEEAFDLADKVVIFNRGLIEQVCVGGGGGVLVWVMDGVLRCLVVVVVASGAAFVV